MTDPVFKAPPVQAPSFNPVPQPVSQTPQTATPQTVTPQPVTPTVQPEQQAQPAVASPVAQPVLQTPPSAQVPTSPVAAPVETPQAQETSQTKLDEIKAKIPNMDLGQIRDKIQQYLWYVLGAFFIIGMMFGCSMGGGKKQPETKQVAGMEQFIVPNADITQKLARCGRSTQRTDACVFYVLNWEQRDKLAEDFFDYVSEKMKRAPFNVQMVNPTYAKTLIKPGYFAKIQVPKS